ncbi:MAG: holo-ACP synthase [Planctomycetaceae bacterium]|jgi:holo-[acyl-carrier protein] synthase|nr:holo-ACP synthase [Planctomycetaceae bacterium]
MQIIGIGTDIVGCGRMERMLAEHGEHFTSHVFTALESAYSLRGKNAVQHFSGRWAAKEAVLKALGTGWVSGITWRDVEVINDPAGKPVVHLHGGAAKKAAELSITEILLSISHCRSYATAFAVAVGV